MSGVACCSPCLPICIHSPSTPHTIVTMFNIKVFLARLYDLVYTLHRKKEPLSTIKRLPFSKSDCNVTRRADCPVLPSTPHVKLLFMNRLFVNDIHHLLGLPVPSA